MRRPLTIALVVNPLAGVGGPAGLAGSDGAQVQELARQLGSVPRALERAARFLAALDAEAVRVAVTGAGAMGETVLEEHGFASETIVAPADAERTRAADSMAVVRAAVAHDVDLVVFVGGDGTAGDVLDALDGARVPMLGVPAGVKMHSSVFALSPSTAAALVSSWKPERGTVARDVADIDEAARRAGRVVSQLRGEALVPAAPARLQGGKVGAATPSAGSAVGLAAGLRSVLDPSAAWVFGPGSTMGAVAEAMGFEHALLGVDLLLPSEDAKGQERVASLGLSARELEERTRGRRVQLVLSPIGGQGFLLGRGNQQIGPGLLERVRREDLVVLATSAKLADMRGGPLYVDTGDDAIDARLTGYVRVITGPDERAMLRVCAASST